MGDLLFMNCLNATLVGSQMRKRPTSVTTTSWIIIGAIGISAISAFARTAMFNLDMSGELMSDKTPLIPSYLAMSYLMWLAASISGVAMLKGHNWGRFLYIFTSTVGLVNGAIMTSMSQRMIPGLVFFVATVFFLFRPKATDYFSSLRGTAK
jgi:hypothetical protein